MLVVFYWLQVFTPQSDGYICYHSFLLHSQPSSTCLCISFSLSLIVLLHTYPFIRVVIYQQDTYHNLSHRALGNLKNVDNISVYSEPVKSLLGFRFSKALLVHLLCKGGTWFYQLARCLRVNKYFPRLIVRYRRLTYFVYEFWRRATYTYMHLFTWTISQISLYCFHIQIRKQMFYKKSSNL